MSEFSIRERAEIGAIADERIRWYLKRPTTTVVERRTVVAGVTSGGGGGGGLPGISRFLVYEPLLGVIDGVNTDFGVAFLVAADLNARPVGLLYKDANFLGWQPGPVPGFFEWTIVGFSTTTTSIRVNPAPAVGETLFFAIVGVSGA